MEVFVMIIIVFIFIHKIKVEELKKTMVSIIISIKSGHWMTMNSVTCDPIKTIKKEDYETLNVLVNEIKSSIVQATSDYILKEKKDFKEALKIKTKEIEEEFSAAYKKFFPDLNLIIEHEGMTILINSYIQTLDFAAGDGVLYSRSGDNLVFFVFDTDGHGGPSSYAAHQLYILFETFFSEEPYTQLSDLIEYIIKESRTLGERDAEAFFLNVDLKTGAIESYFFGDTFVLAITEDGHYDLKTIENEAGNNFLNISHRSGDDIAKLRNAKPNRYFIDEIKAIVVMTDGYWNSYYKDTRAPIEKPRLSLEMDELFRAGNFPESIIPFFEETIGDKPLPEDDKTYLTIIFSKGEKNGKNAAARV